MTVRLDYAGSELLLAIVMRHIPARAQGGVRRCPGQIGKPARKGTGFLQDRLLLLGEEGADLEGVVPLVRSERRRLCARVRVQVSDEGAIRPRRRMDRRRAGEDLGRFCLDRLGRERAGGKGARDSVACETLQGQTERHGEGVSPEEWWWKRETQRRFAGAQLGTNATGFKAAIVPT